MTTLSVMRWRGLSGIDYINPHQVNASARRTEEIERIWGAIEGGSRGIRDKQGHQTGEQENRRTEPNSMNLGSDPVVPMVHCAPDRTAIHGTNCSTSIGLMDLIRVIVANCRGNTKN